MDGYGGRLATLALGLAAAHGSHLRARLEYRRETVALPAGGFEAHLPGLRLVWSLSPRLGVSAFVQYNRLESRLLADLRLDLVHRRAAICSWS